MKRMASLFAGILALLLTPPAVAVERIVEWVEDAPIEDITKVALGYPTPMPVETPLPFDGFRTYAGLHTRHQDLAATSDYVHAVEIGTTRAGRVVWAYRLGDADFTTIYGNPEAATLTNGGIHAREWQSPETLTGIMELMVAQQENRHFYGYLLDNVNMIIIPVLNVDGFLQTQRFPRNSYLGTDPSDVPEDPNDIPGPRDGRLRRKNMLMVDEDLFTKPDHLMGVDLNRNNAPYWATSTRSSPEPSSIVHHGASPHSEPETQALAAAADLGPAEQLRVYTDVHSFTRLHLWPRNLNDRLAAQQVAIFNTFTNHHLALPGGVWYAFAGLPHSGAIGVGIGATDEYFLYTHQVPSWTLEIEPTQGQDWFGTPGCGADYGGLARNCHDGFILPDSEIRRVRENLAETFAAVYYRQAGPPSITAMRFVDTLTNAVVFEAEWDTVDENTRVLHKNQIQPLELGRQYKYWVSYDKPMRWRSNGTVVPFPGQPSTTLNMTGGSVVDDTTLTSIISNQQWLNQPGDAPMGYSRYEDDAFSLDFQFPRNVVNTGVVNGSVEATISNGTTDMVGLQTDANPATRATWRLGNWQGYEDDNGLSTDNGGTDSSITLQVTDEFLDPPFVLEPGTAGAWYDLDHTGEGFILEMLDDDAAILFWFTFNHLGEQDWFISVGEVRGNRILFAELLRVTGGEFGPGFDPTKIKETPVGSATFIWSGCDSGSMEWNIGNQHGRQQLVRLTTLMGLECGQARLSPLPEHAVLSGSWYDPTHAGEGYTIEVLADGHVVVYWFSFGPDGERRWFFGLGEVIDGKMVFDNMLTTSGGIFGDDFDPTTVDELPWGTLELDIDCDGGTASYTSTEEGFGSGTLNVFNLTSMAGLGCDA